MSLPDIQNTKDLRGKYIPKVGIRNVTLPFKVRDKANEIQNTVANISMYVSLHPEKKGIDMSRVPGVLMDNIDEHISVEFIEAVLKQLKEKLGSESSYIKIRFPYFMKKKAPSTDKESYFTHDCILEGQLVGEEHSILLTVEVDYTSCCPCSKEMSSLPLFDNSGLGAHNQRSRATVTVKLKGFVWIEDIASVVEETASCQIYNVLKRPDEKHVTEAAYTNPKFVEDMVRDISIALEKSDFYSNIGGYVVTCNHYESIHQHDAVAVIRGGEEELR